MTAGLTTARLRGALRRLAEAMEKCSEELNRLDGQLGDGDLGVTMLRGARSISEEIEALPDDVGMAFIKCAQAMTRISGSTFGSLLAFGLMSAAKRAKGRTEIPLSEISALLADALEAMSLRGKAQLGDKTILDAIDAARQASAAAAGTGEMVTACNRAVEESLDRLRNVPAKQGRARIFAEKSVGLDDPGMVAFKRIVEALGPEESH